MAYDPMQGFQVGQKIGESKKSSLNRTSGYMSDLTAQRDKDKTKINPLELMMLKQAMPQPDTGVYSWNPLSGKLEQEAAVPKGSIVRNTTTEDDLRRKYSVRNEFESPTEAEVSKKVIAEGMVKRIGELKGVLTSDVDKFSGTKIKASLPFGLMDKKAQRYDSVQRALADDLLRLKSGAQINEQEFQRLSKLLTKPWRYDDVDIQNLTDFENQFTSIADRINKGFIWDGNAFKPGSSNALMQGIQNSNQDTTSDPKELYNQLREQGMSKEEAKAQAGII